jgi:hypothetical protein
MIYMYTKYLLRILAVAAAFAVCDIGISQTSPLPVGTIAPGDSIIIVYSATVNSGPTITNQGSISGTNFTTFNTNDPKTPAAGDATVTTVTNQVTFTGTVFLQGSYSSSSGTMANGLNTLGILQLKATSQPYNSSTYSYFGTESVGADFFAAHTDIVDWVLIELRDAATPVTIVARRAAFVKQNGTVVDVNGIDPVAFPNIAATNYYVAIRHRNHLGIRSAAPVNFSSGAASYNFTTARANCFENLGYSSTVLLGSIWAMRAGNAFIDGVVKYNGPDNDQNQILNVKLGGLLSTVKSNEYAPEDINMDGTVKWNGPDNDQNFLLNIILEGLLSTAYNEQL